MLPVATRGRLGVRGPNVQLTIGPAAPVESRSGSTPTAWRGRHCGIPGSNLSPLVAGSVRQR